MWKGESTLSRESTATTANTGPTSPSSVGGPVAFSGLGIIIITITATGEAVRAGAEHTEREVHLAAAAELSQGRPRGGDHYEP